MGEINVRERLQTREKSFLSPYAAYSAASRGREVREEPCEYRTDYQRDRDRIIHCKSFRRLMHKTQVFLSPEEDHYRTRMTHTVEVMQIARTMARALALNEDLTEAIAFGHDLGHTPFGHAGEAVLQKCFSPDFHHAKQSLRVVEKLEHGREGLNLTWEVRDGILHHSGGEAAATLEGVLVKYADRIAYINHDMDDAVRAKVITPEDVPAELREIFGSTTKSRIDTMVTSVIRSSIGKQQITMEPEIGAAMNRFRDFMFDHVYYNPAAKRDEEKAKAVLEELYTYFLAHPDKMPREYQYEEEPAARRVCDYLSGMTDRYAIRTYTELKVPKMFK